MITVQDLKTKTPDEMTDNLAFAVTALIKTTRLALENDSPHSPDAYAVSVTLGIAESLAEVLGEGCEILERKIGCNSDASYCSL
mgnify:CR=1 FL=1